VLARERQDLVGCLVFTLADMALVFPRFGSVYQLHRKAPHLPVRHAPLDYIFVEHLQSLILVKVFRRPAVAVSTARMPHRDRPRDGVSKTSQNVRKPVELEGRSRRMGDVPAISRNIVEGERMAGEALRQGRVHARTSFIERHLCEPAHRQVFSPHARRTASLPRLISSLRTPMHLP